MSKKEYFRPEIAAMNGYTPGEQPQMSNIVKLNTNENPYPPSPTVAATLADMEWERLRLYPDPDCSALRQTIAQLFDLQPNNIIAGNGSDDILTIIFRCFTDSQRAMACLEPTYSLYRVLADIQGCRCLTLPLQADFSLPDNLLPQAADANLLIITRPNAPTGNSFPRTDMARLCAEFDGIVVIDEAYADFAGDNCIDLIKQFDNLIVTRTLSKSYSLAGARLGLALAAPALISGMMKVKDSYNVNALTQLIGRVALQDQQYLKETVNRIIAERRIMTSELRKMNFTVVDSEANFIFAAPPDGDGESYFQRLREQAIIVRYFPGPVTGKYVRITIGTPEQNRRLLDFTSTIFPE